MPNKKTTSTYAEAIHSGLDYSLENDSNVVVIGEGVPDPKGIFGTTSGLQKKYGVDRVYDMPLSENAMTGICIGAALNGLRPILIHQRIDFSLLSLDQIINNAAKWHYMFDGKMSVPLVIRMIIGRGWGQGPQHSQSLQSIFAHIPGLKVCMPTFANDAKNMLIHAIKDNNPVIFLEHRWLHPIEGEIDNDIKAEAFLGAKIIKPGADITIVAFSYMVVEALYAAKIMEKIGLSVEVVDMRYVSPIDHETVQLSVKKTGRLVVTDTGSAFCGVSAEVIASVCEGVFHALKKPPIRIAGPDHPIPTSHHVAHKCYPGAEEIVKAVLSKFEIDADFEKIKRQYFTMSSPKDVPYHDFLGPF